MSESESPENERSLVFSMPRRQVSLGKIEEEKANHINTIVETTKLKILELKLPKPKTGEFLANFIDVFGDSVQQWLTTSLSAREAFNAAKASHLQRSKKVEEDIDKIIRQALIEIHEVVAPQIAIALERYLEARYG